MSLEEKQAGNFPMDCISAGRGKCGLGKSWRTKELCDFFTCCEQKESVLGHRRWRAASCLAQQVSSVLLGNTDVSHAGRSQKEKSSVPLKIKVSDNQGSGKIVSIKLHTSIAQQSNPAVNCLWTERHWNGICNNIPWDCIVIFLHLLLFCLITSQLMFFWSRKQSGG